MNNVDARTALDNTRAIRNVRECYFVGIDVIKSATETPLAHPVRNVVIIYALTQSVKRSAAVM